MKSIIKFDLSHCAICESPMYENSRYVYTMRFRTFSILLVSNGLITISHSIMN